MSWTKDESLKILAIWADDHIEAKLEGCHHNREVYERVAKLLGEEWYKCTYKQCHEKLKKIEGRVSEDRGQTG